MKTTLLFLSLAIAAASIQAQTDSTHVGRLLEHQSEAATVVSIAFGNPAVNQLRHATSLSRIEGAFTLRKDNEAVDIQLGHQDNTIAFDADTYIKHRTSTIWGHATYQNGRQHGIRWNETSDPERVGPYLLADSVATSRMKLERYGFGGGYANRNGRWLWGVEGGYDAGLYYRSSDPRPRNVTSQLRVSLGGGLNVTPRYIAAIALGYQKYKQTNNVAFFSELGQERLFHLTGLGNDYGRFAGTGYETYYKGNQFLASATFHPIQNGLSATIQAERFSFDNVLTSLNKLPLAHVSHNSVHAELAWIERVWRVAAHINASRRVGTENIFGDAASQVYPKIGAIDMFHQNRFDAAINGVWRLTGRRFTLEIHPRVRYDHQNAIYPDPACRQLINNFHYGMRIRAARRFHTVSLAATIGADFCHNLKRELTLTNTKTELLGLRQAIERTHTLLSHNRSALEARLAAAIPLSNRFALQIALRYQHTRYTLNTHTNHFKSSICLIF